MKENRDSGRLWAILSLSMANALVGTGISPALAVMKEYFSDASPIHDKRMNVFLNHTHLSSKIIKT